MEVTPRGKGTPLKPGPGLQLDVGALLFNKKKTSSKKLSVICYMFN